MSDYEQWSIDRIQELRAEASGKMAEASTLEKNLAEWRRLTGKTMNRPAAPAVLSGVAKQLDPFRAPPAKNGHGLQEGSWTYLLLKFIYESADAGMSMRELYSAFKSVGYDKGAAIRSMAYSQKALDRIKLVNNRYFYAGSEPKEIGVSSSEEPKQNQATGA